MTLSNYPQVAVDVKDEFGSIVLIYFLPLILMTVFIFIPVPVAVMFDHFRVNFKIFIVIKSNNNS